MSNDNVPIRESDRDALEWLIEPVSRVDFERDFYERRQCLVARTDRSYYHELLSPEDLDAVLGTHNITYPEVKLVQDEQDIPPRSYTDVSGRIDPIELASRFDQGATIIFEQLHRRVPALARLCVSVGRVLGSRVQTNIYLTPPHAQGFQPHWDTHDVFVLQVEGTKKWSIYDTNVSLPLRGQGFDPRQHVLGPVTEQFELNAGDAVYLPRGVVHSATASEHVSLHITLGLTAFTWTDFLLESVAAAAMEDDSLRETLPLGFADGSCSADDRARMYREKLRVLQSRLDPAPVWRHFEREVLASNTPLTADLLGWRVREDRVTLDSFVGKRPDLMTKVETSGSGSVLRFSQRELRLPGHVQPAIDFVLSHETFAVRDLPECIDAESKVIFARRLLKEGLLQLRAHHEGGEDDSSAVVDGKWFRRTSPRLGVGDFSARAAR